MSPAHDIMHDEEKTRTPSHPSMANAFDRLVESNLELVASVRELAADVRALVTAIAEGKK